MSSPPSPSWGTGADEAREHPAAVPRKNTTENDKHAPRVVIVGAGFAGIAAAGALRARGVTDVLILEAQARPGGRVQNVQLDDGFVEIGAQFIHGERGNDLYELAEKFGLLLDKDEYRQTNGDLFSDSSAEDFRDHHFYSSDGGLLPPERAARLLHVANQIFRHDAISYFHKELGESENLPTCYDYNYSNSNQKKKKTKKLSTFSDKNVAEVDPEITRSGSDRSYESAPRQNSVATATTTSATTTTSISTTTTTSKDVDSNHLSKNPSSGSEKGRCWPEDEGHHESFQEMALHDLRRPNDYIVKYEGRATTIIGNGDGGQQQEEVRFADLLRESRQRLLELGEEEPEEIKLAVLRWMEQWEYTDNGARLQDMSLQAYGKYCYIPGYGLTVTSSGLEDVFKAFLQDTLSPHESSPSPVLLLNTPVKTIFWTAEPSQGQEASAAKKKTQEKTQSKTQERTQEKTQAKTQEKTHGVPPPTSEPVPPNNKGKAQETPEQPQDSGGDCRKPIKLSCEDGQEFWADHVIVTSSVGYLKENEATLFKPGLPDNVRQAVHKMGFGVVAKVMLVWDRLEGILGQDVEGVQFLWVDGIPVRPPSDLTARKTRNGGNWYDVLQGFERVLSHKGALMTWLAGEEAEIMGSLPEQEVKDVLLELLVQFLGNPLLPPPRQVVRSMWHSNPYIRGAYSYIPALMEPEAHDLLSLPLPSIQNPVLQLSGEATSRSFYSTVHGAIDSGRRAACAILSQLLPSTAAAAAAAAATTTTTTTTTGTAISSTTASVTTAAAAHVTAVSKQQQR